MSTGTIHYGITKEQCATHADGRVCPCCGEPVEPIETEDNAGNPTYWAGCLKCSRFSWGVTTFVFAIAKCMVDEKNYIPYSHLGVKTNHPESEWPEWYRSQYSGACGDVANILSIEKEILEKVNKY